MKWSDYRRRPVISTTQVWTRNHSEWSRFLLREQAGAPTQVDRLLAVDSSLPVCIHCLSNNVILLRSETYDDGELFCNDCQVQYGILDL